MEEHKHITVDLEDENDDSKTPTTEISPISLPDKIEIIRLPTEEDVECERDIDPRSTFHVYEKHEVHKCISPVVDPLKERRFGPTPKQQKARRIQKKERQDSGLPPLEPDDTAFFLHQPYLSFHMPPRVLYMGNSKHTAKPAVLVHERCFWREYKLQLGPSISQPGVLDPRGVVAWRHNGGDKKALKANDHKLKGYKVRGWRLWGETGKEYVHAVKAARKTGKGPDPDVLKVEGSTPESPAVAEEVVYLRWSNPFSRHTRRYHFQYLGIDFYWKGTGSVSETRACGLLCRFNHLKLVVKLPLTEGKKNEQVEWCLGKFTNSVACKKNGKLEFFDAEILRLIEEHMPSVLASSSGEEQVNDEVGNERILSLRKSQLYQVFIATAMCMIRSEKEKRHTLLDLIVALAEGGGSGG